MRPVSQENSRRSLVGGASSLKNCLSKLFCSFLVGGLVAKLCPTLATPWTVAYQTPLSMGLPRQGYWSRLPFPSPGDLPNPGIKSGFPALQVGSLPTELQGNSFLIGLVFFIIEM